MMTFEAPRRANLAAAAYPIPDVAPVTRTVRSVKDSVDGTGGVSHFCFSMLRRADIVEVNQDLEGRGVQVI